MKIQIGYICHIEDEYFDKVKDSGLSKNHENERLRPTYFAIKDGDILWFIPPCSKYR